MITSDTVTPAQAEKLLLVIKTAVRTSDMFHVRCASSSYIPCAFGILRNLSAHSAVEVYQDLLQQEQEGPSTFRFSFCSREGSVIERELKPEELVMGIGLPVGRRLMDLSMELLVEHGPPQFMAAPSLPGQIEDAIGWICTNPPPSDWHGLRMMPLLTQSRWCLLVADYHESLTDLCVPHATRPPPPTYLIP